MSATPVITGTLGSTLPLVGPPMLGCTKDELDTPALCLDLDVMEANIRQVATTCRQHGVAWRPHSKGHKVAQIARQEIEAGALGVTCAKLAEAELMAAGGIADLLIANFVVGPRKLVRLAGLAKVARPIVCVDHADQVRPMSAALASAGVECRVLIEVDLGLARAGVQPGPAVLELAQLITASPGLKFAGVMGYEGHLLTVADLIEKAARIHAALAVLVGEAENLRASGIPCPIVSCAGTGSYLVSAAYPGITEVQAGGAIFMDAFYRQKCQVPNLQFALTVTTTVVSRPAPNRAIIDAGRKTLNIEIHTPLVLGQSDLRVTALSAEHGQLEVGPTAAHLAIGDRLELIPGYADMTTVLHDAYHCFRGGRLVAVWPIEGRGKLT